MKKIIKQYIKSGMAIYTLVVLIIICLFFAFAINLGAKGATNDWDKIEDAAELLNSIIPFTVWILIPYFVILGVRGLYYYIVEFVITPLNENMEGVDR